MDEKTLSHRLLSVIKSPAFIAVAIIAAASIIALWRMNDYGITWDEPIQSLYGLVALHWYVTRGADLRFLSLGGGLQYHGAFVEWLIALIQVLTHHFWGVRSIATIMMGISGFIAITLCGFEMKKPWVGVVALVLFILFPRYSGDIFTNSKDVPFAASYCFVLWGVFRLINGWSDTPSRIRNSALVGTLIGIAAAIRVVAVIWWPVLGLLALGYVVSRLKGRKAGVDIKGDLIKIALSGAIVFVVSYAVMTLLWPFVLMNPITNFIEAVRDMSHFPFSTPIMFMGQVINPTHTPRDFSLVWIAIATPVATLIMLFVGLGFFIKGVVERKVNVYIATALLSVIIPLITVIGFDATLYSGIRQILFLVPSLLLIAAYGFVELMHVLMRRRVFVIMISMGVVLYYAGVVGVMMQLHPYEYLYFNELVGGLHGAQGRYELDYWGASYKACSEWLGGNYAAYTKAPIIHVDPNTTDHVQIMKYLPINFVVDTTTPNFYITAVWDESWGFETKYPKSKVIYQVERFGTPLCEVKLVTPQTIATKPAINPTDYSSTWESWVRQSWRHWAQN